MKLTEEQIWKCNNTINYEGGEVVDAVHICLDHQNVVDFARAIEREICFDRAELWLKRINEAVLAEREACAKLVGELAQTWWSIHCASNKHMETTRKAHDAFCAVQAAIRARGNT